MKTILGLGLMAALAVFGAEKQKHVGTAGQFDYYLMTLSWSPAYCASGGGGEQCSPGRGFAFVLHGLWPQYAKPVKGHGWPQFCSDEPGLKDTKTMLDIMPASTLISHEWEKHGTCSGLDAEGYFATARKAFESVKTPAEFQAPKEYITISPEEVKKAFLDANPGMSAEALSIGCSSNYLSEVRVCMDRSLKAMPCTGQRDCKASKVRMPPVR